MKQDLRALVDGAATPEELAEVIGALEGAKASAYARLASKTVPRPAAEDRLLNMVEVAERLGITEHQAREMGRRGEIPVTTVGERFVRVRASALEDWILQRGARRR
jgi:excisionase family DNA binding protein